MIYHFQDSNFLILHRSLLCLGGEKAMYLTIISVTLMFFENLKHKLVQDIIV